MQMGRYSFFISLYLSRSSSIWILHRTILWSLYVMQLFSIITSFTICCLSVIMRFILFLVLPSGLSHVHPCVVSFGRNYSFALGYFKVRSPSSKFPGHDSELFIFKPMLFFSWKMSTFSSEWDDVGT